MHTRRAVIAFALIGMVLAGCGTSGTSGTGAPAAAATSAPTVGAAAPAPTTAAASTAAPAGATTPAPTSAATAAATAVATAAPTSAPVAPTSAATAASTSGAAAAATPVATASVGATGASPTTTSGSATTGAAISTPNAAFTANCPTGQAAEGNGATVKIGSKPFAEEQLLATMTQLVLQKHGFKVDYTTQAADPAIDQALRSGSVDMLWQYTGTELQQFLKVDSPPTDLNAAFAMTRDQDASNNLCWVAPAPMNDTNGLAIKASDKGTLGDTLTAFAGYLQAHPDTKVCIMSEFRTRADGVPGLQKAYGAGFGGANYVDIGSTAEAAIASGQCNAGEVFTTDSAIAAKNLYVLQDDKKLFPPDNVGLVVRSDVLKKYPAIATLMTPVAAKLTTDVMVDLNRQVEVDKKKVSDVAQGWLTQNGLL